MPGAKGNNKVKANTKSISANVGVMMAWAGVIVAPVFTANSVYLAVIAMGRPFWTAWAAALALWLVGFAAVDTAVMMWAYNAEKLKSQPPAPFVMAVLAVAIYIAVAMLATTALEILPAIRPFVAYAFPIFEAIGMAILGLRIDHDRRLANNLAEVENRKAERQRQRNERAERIEQKANADVRPERSPEHVIDKPEALKIITVYVGENKGATIRQLAALVGKSTSTTSGYVNGLIESGELCRNGNGLEVVARG